MSKPASAPRPESARGRYRLVAGWLVLVAYLVTCSPLGLAVGALLGSLDPQHQIRVSSSEQGLQLVLHHGHNCAVHRHGAVACVLTLFAQPASATDPDHVLQFGKAEGYTQKAQISAPLPATIEQPIFTSIETPFCAPHEPQPSSVPPYPPPDGGGRLVRLLSTQLLI